MPFEDALTAVRTSMHFAETQIPSLRPCWKERRASGLSTGPLKGCRGTIHLAESAVCQFWAHGTSIVSSWLPFFQTLRLVDPISAVLRQTINAESSLKEFTLHSAPDADIDHICNVNHITPHDDTSYCIVLSTLTIRTSLLTHGAPEFCTDDLTTA